MAKSHTNECKQKRERVGVINQGGCLMLMTESTAAELLANPHYAPREKSIRVVVSGKRESLRKNDGMEVMTVGPTPPPPPNSAGCP